MKERESKFGTALSEAVQEGLDGICPSVADIVLSYVQRKAPNQHNDHGLDPEAFDGCLKGLLGWGAQIVERKILECLHKKLEVQTEIRKGFVFADEVKKARDLLCSSQMLVTEHISELEINLK